MLDLCCRHIRSDDDDLDEDDSIVSRALVTCLKFVSLLTRGSDQAMDRMFDELPNLLASENTEGRLVSAQMASTLAEVFAKPKFQLKVRARDLEQIMDRMFELFKEGEFVAELLDLLRSMADSTGSDAGMQRNQQLIVSYLMQHESNVISVLHVKKMKELRELLNSDDGSNEMYDYHISLVELLAMLADGRSKIPSLSNREYAQEHCPWGDPISVLSGRHPATFYFYADARYIDTVIVHRPEPVY